MFVNRLVRIAILTGVACLLLAGCNKAGDDSSRPAGAPSGKAPAAGGENAGTAPGVEGAAQAGNNLFAANSPTEEHVAKTIRDMLPFLAPQHECTVDLAADKLTSDKDPQKTEKVSEFAQRLAAQVIASEEPISNQLISDLVAEALNVFAASKPDAAVQGGAAADKSGGLDDRETVERLKNSPVDLSAQLKTPERLIGNWRSIAEIKDSAMVNHDDSYYDLLTFADREKGSYTTFREGKQASHRTFTYTFDTRSGRLLIRFEDGDAWTILLQQPVDNAYELRLNKLSEGLTTVFRMM